MAENGLGPTLRYSEGAILLRNPQRTQSDRALFEQTFCCVVKRIYLFALDVNRAKDVLARVV